MSKTTTGIYKITSPSGRVYIGQSVKCEHRRSQYKRGSPNQPKLNNSIKKYGWDAHTFEIIHVCEREELNKLEIYYADLFNSYDLKYGLNVRQCGGSKGKLAAESIAKFKETYKKKKANGYISPNLGRKASEEHRRNMSEARKKLHQNGFVSPRKGTKMSEAAKENLRKINTGKRYSLGMKRTDEQKAKITAALKKRWERQKANGDFKQSEEHKAKRLSKIKGSKRTEEQKLNMKKPRSAVGRANIRTGILKQKEKEGYYSDEAIAKRSERSRKGILTLKADPKYFSEEEKEKRRQRQLLSWISRKKNMQAK